MTCTFRPEDFQFITTIGKSKVKHATNRTSDGCLHTACGMFTTSPGATDRWSLARPEKFDVTCKQCMRAMDLIENERKDGVIDNDDTVFVVREKASGYFFKNCSGRNWVKQINKASTFSSMNSGAIKIHIGELHYFRGGSEISGAVYLAANSFDKRRFDYRQEYIINFDKYEIISIKLVPVLSENIPDADTKKLIDISSYFKYDIGDVVIVRERSKSKLTHVERRITARSINFFIGGHEVIYTVKNITFDKFYKVDQCDIVGAK